MKKEQLKQIKEFLEMQMDMFDMAMKDPKTGFAQRQGVKHLKKKCQNSIDSVTEELSLIQ